MSKWDFNKAANSFPQEHLWWDDSVLYSYVLDYNICFFEHANELPVQIHLTSFIEFTMILNQT